MYSQPSLVKMQTNNCAQTLKVTIFIHSIIDMFLIQSIEQTEKDTLRIKANIMANFYCAKLQAIMSKRISDSGADRIRIKLIHVQQLNADIVKV